MKDQIMEALRQVIQPYKNYNISEDFLIEVAAQGFGVAKQFENKKYAELKWRMEGLEK